MSWCGGGEMSPTPGGRVTSLGDPWVDLVAGQLTALSRLGALGHLDLDVVCLSQIQRGHSEAARGDLLDGRAAHRVQQAVLVLPALTGLRPAPNAVHRDRNGLVGLLADGAAAHRTG